MKLPVELQHKITFVLAKLIAILAPDVGLIHNIKGQMDDLGQAEIIVREEFNPQVLVHKCYSITTILTDESYKELKSSYAN